MGLLDGGLQGIMGAALASLYTDVTLTRTSLTDDGKGGYTAGGPSTATVKVQRNDFSDFTRSQLNIPTKDARFLILQHGAGMTPRREDTFPHGGVTWKIVDLSADPANVYWAAHVTPG